MTETAPSEAPPDQPGASDADLAGLPPPRRPWRRTTLVTLAVCAALSIGLAVAVVPDVLYVVRGGTPVELGDLGRARLDPDLSGEWVHGEGQLSATRAIRYRRPLERDSYRLAQLDGNPHVWVEVRVPANEEGERFVPPASFVGRLIRASDLGLRQRGLLDAVGEAGLERPGDDAWLLLDGESPAALRWALGLFGLLVAFAAFNVVGLVRLGRPILASS